MLKHVQKGQPLRIAAADWNQIIDVTRAQLETKGASRPIMATACNRSSGIITVKNASGQDQSQFAVLGIDTPIILPEDNVDEFKRQVALSCVLPTSAHSNRFVILQEPLAIGAIGRACIQGVTNVRLQTDTPEVYRAGIVEDESQWLTAGSNGCSVLWTEEDAQPDGWRWAIVRLGDSSSDIFPARITSTDNGAHAWTEVQPQGGGSFSDLEGGRSGTTGEYPAFEINGRTAVPSNTIVWMMPVNTGDGTAIYLFDLGMGNAGTTASLTHSGEHGENAALTTWNINSQTTSRGVSLTVQTGSRYDHNAATPILYAYLRNLSFDANGHLVAIGPESRVVIDSPEACP